MVAEGVAAVLACGRRFAPVLCLVALSLQAGVAGAQEPLRGVALVVGLSDYENLPDLPNPSGDARAVDNLLSDLGFDVDSVIDRDSRQLSRAIERFEEDAEGADVALIYYAGHGVEAGGENFLVPTDAAMPANGPASDFIAVGPLLAKLQQKAKIVILLLDACRTNPIPDGTVVATAEGQAPVAAIGLGQPRGAVSLRGEGPETLGAVLGYAAEPGKAALDGQPGAHSPYADALPKHLSAGGCEFGDVYTREVDPNAYAISSYNEGRALLFLGRYDNDLQRFEEARIALAETTDVMSTTHNPILWARARSVLGEVLFEIGTRANDRQALVDARTAFDDARTTFTRNGMGDSGQGFWAKQIAAIDARLGK
ncbi:caspase family protein [Mesorhizobium sp. VNQ89]|uniref:caspase family protein n=1 Tax=Mesorhizobium quangtriensis TaxID=3157709 RepID=UPI0032B8557F